MVPTKICWLPQKKVCGSFGEIILWEKSNVRKMVWEFVLWGIVREPEKR